MLVKSFGRTPVRLRQTVAMPMGILYLSAVIERDHPGAKVRVVDFAKRYREWADSDDAAPEDLDAFLRAVLATDVPSDSAPAMIGISILFSTADKTSRHVAAVCKERWPNVPVVLGGMHATSAVDSLLKEEAIDYVCRGEAESIIVDLVRTCHEGRDPESVQGIIGRSKASRENAPLIDDLDEIPYPAWHLLPMHEYVECGRARSIEKIEQDHEATIVTTRGCPFRCTFCASWTVHGREMRYRSVENVLGELRILRERYGVTSVIPEDDLFTVKKPRIIALCEAVAEEFPGLTFQFPNGLSVATLDEDVVRAMCKMGMKVANIAIESGSDYVQRKIIKKNVNLDRARRVVQTCRDLGITTRCYFILGFPGETREQVMETIAFAESLPADWCVFNIAAPLIGTEMYEQLLARGEIDGSFNWDEAFFHERAYDTPEVSANDLKALCEEANLRVNFYGNYNLRNGQPDRAAALFRDIHRMYPDHKPAKECLEMASA
jgi:radical SAM superfamily enzyme YgiQ (UPF0313 family)